MEQIAYEIELMMAEKLSLYERLSEVMGKESEAIASMDLEFLWESAREKKALAGTLESIRQRIISTLEAFSLEMGMDSKSFSLGFMVETLPLSDGAKAGLRRMKLKINTAKDQVVQLAQFNQSQVKNYLSVVDDIMSVIGDNSSQAQYTGQGMMPGKKRHNCIIRAEV